MLKSENITYASCDMDLLYIHGGFSEDGSLSGQIASSNNAAKFICKIYENPGYARPLPSSIYAPDKQYAEDRVNFLNDLNKSMRNGITSALFLLSDAIILDNGIYTNKDGATCAVYETFRPQDLEHLSLSDPVVNFTDDHPDGINLAFSSGGSFNYGHWITEDLPRLKAFFILRKKFPNRHINIIFRTYNPIIDQVRLQSIKAFLGSDRNYSILRINREEARSFKELYYASPIAVPPVIKSPEALRSVSSKMRRYALQPRIKILLRSVLNKGPGGLRRKIFVERHSDYDRKLVNRDAVASMLSEFGFEIVDPLLMTFRQQIAVFADARVVVGVMGAAMTNTMFCSPGIPVVHLAVQGWDDPFFWDLACARKQSYHVIYGKNSSKANPNREPFHVDVAQLRRLIVSLV
ncbi:glycosyltransferase family 61 protein [Methylobacterium nonmethylotrophicum]|uniref:Glycosyltransferase family 61 protein n=1 Tax=Methylobacterium nonmethylotrophicum TaxID=1141884 RepID=A0A4Z0NVV2_9HYPH|nr:glycosyltransferase 61 family protein [Methylobacterium nonmethylotrophicum]TGE01843.1 glycosyltransferase family 61 protein [Methylobacterium nonmethylotrophicum]